MTKAISLLIGLGLTGFGTTAFAAVDLSAATVAPDPAQTGQSVSVSIEAQRSGSGCSNNWGYTKVFLDGVQVGTTTLGAFSGSGTTTDSFDLGSFNDAGNHVVDVELWSGEEDFNNGGASPDCTDTLLDTDSASFSVEAPAPAPSSKPKQTSYGGGGGYTYCDLHNGYPVTDVHNCIDRTSGKIVQTLAWRNGGIAAAPAIDWAKLNTIKSVLTSMLLLIDSLR